MANRFWVGGASTWDGTAGSKWATTSGGGGGAAVPTNLDDVFFDAASGANIVTLSSGTRSAKTVTCTGFTGTLAGTGSMTVSGNILLVAGMSFTNTGVVTVTGTVACNLTSAGKTLNRLTCSSTNTVTLQDNLTVTSTITLNLGGLDTNGKTISSGTLTVTGTPTLTLGASVITLTTAQAVSFASTATLNCGTSSITTTFGSTGASHFAGGGKTWYDVSILCTITKTISDVNTFHNLTLTTGADKRAIVIISSQTVTGTFTVTGNSLINRIICQSPTLGTASTITAAICSLSNCDFMDITGAGAGSWTGTSLGNALGNSGITFTTPVTRYFVGGIATSTWSATSSWSTSSGGASGASVPLCHDDVVINLSGSFTTLNMDMPRACANFDASAAARTFTLSIGAPSNSTMVYGSFYHPPTNVTWNTLNGISLIFKGRSSLTCTHNSQTMNYATTIEMFGGTLTISGNGIYSSVFTLLNGVLDAANYNMTLGSFVSNGALTRTLTMGSGTWTVGNQTPTGTVWDTGTTTGLTFNKNTSTIKVLTGASVTNIFTGGGLTFYNIWFALGGAATTLQVSDANTFNDLKHAAGLTLQFTAGTTTTFASYTPLGSAGNLSTLGSITASNHTLAKSGGGTVVVDYVSVSRSTGSPASTFYAGSNSTDGGNNINWTFGTAATGNFLAFF